MGIVYSGNFQKLLGLLHPSVLGATTTEALIPAQNTGWVGQAQPNTISASNGLLAVGYITNAHAPLSGPQLYDGHIAIFQLDAQGTINDLADTISPTSTSGQRFLPVYLAFSADGNYLAVQYTCYSNTSLSGVYVYQKSANAFTLTNTFYTTETGPIVWHSSNTEFALGGTSIQVYSIITNNVGTLTNQISAIRGTVAWLGNDLVYAYYDASNNYAVRWGVYTKSFITNSVTMTATKTGIVLSSSMAIPTSAISVGSGRLIVTNTSSGLMVYDFNYFGSGNFSAKTGPSVTASPYTANYVTYSSVSKRLILGNSSETRLFNDATGTLTSVSSAKLTATNDVIGVIHDDVSGNLIVMGEYDITSYYIPTGAGYVPPANPQPNSSTVFAWAMNYPYGSTNFAPTISTNQSVQTVTVTGSPTFQSAPGKVGYNALKFTNEGLDKLVWPKARDFQFMYSAFTIEIYLYFITGNTGGYILGDGNNFFLSYSTGNTFRFKYYDQTLPFTLIKDTWNHIAITYSGSATPTSSSTPLVVFVNGIIQNTASLKQINTTDVPFYPNNLHWGYLSIGGLVNYADGTNPSSVNGFSGYMHQLNIYNYVKYAARTFTPPAF